jgi:hypothetical protein
MGLTTSNMLVRLSISQWQGKKFDKRVTEKVAQDYQAKGDVGRYTKQTIAKDALAEIASTANAARAKHYELTLPWLRDDYCILPAGLYLEYVQIMNGFTAKFNVAVSKFLGVYPSLKAQAKTSLNGLYNEADYPSERRLKGLFHFDYSVIPLPAAQDFRVSMADDIVKKIQEDIEERGRVAVAGAMANVWSRLYGVVSKMADVLSVPNPRIYETLVSNIADLCKLLPALNITDSPDLERLRAAVESKLVRYDADSLRERPMLRQETAGAAREIAQEVKGFLPEPEPVEPEPVAGAPAASPDDVAAMMGGYFGGCNDGG